MKTGIFQVTLLLVLTSIVVSGAPQRTTRHSVDGALRVHPENPRYFTDNSGQAILLTGSHTWNNLVDMGNNRFDFDRHLDWLAAYPHNFFRLWTWELLTWNTQGNRESKARIHQVRPLPWKRTGPGDAVDGKPKFNLEKHNEEYFARLRQRVEAAQNRGIYAAVMLFEGWGIQFSPDGWQHHPFHPNNNINGINGDLDADGKGLEIHSGRHREITRFQQSYVRKVVDSVNEFDNVLYEISNENHPGSTQWQYSMIRFIKDYERTKPKQHPVGMTFQYKGGSNQTLFDSPADWISPNHQGGYRDNPPAAEGSKVVITDTDHLWGIGGNSGWVWKSFLRGLNPIFMDCYDGSVLNKNFDIKWAEPLRKSMGQALQWARRVNLAAMTPQPSLASSKYCLANLGVEYLVYHPVGDTELSLKLPSGKFVSVWFDPATGKENQPDTFDHAGGERTFTLPAEDEALLYVRGAK